MPEKETEEQLLSARRFQLSGIDELVFGKAWIDLYNNKIKFHEPPFHSPHFDCGTASEEMRKKINSPQVQQDYEKNKKSLLRHFLEDTIELRTGTKKMREILSESSIFDAEMIEHFKKCGHGKLYERIFKNAPIDEDSLLKEMNTLFKK